MVEPTQRTTQTQKPQLLAFRDVCGPELAPRWHGDLAEAPSLGATLLQCPSMQVCGRLGSWHNCLWGLCPRKPGG